MQNELHRNRIVRPLSVPDIFKTLKGSRKVASLCNGGLRSGQQHLLRVPQTRLLTFGDSSFAFAAPKLWNSLPFKIREAASLGAFKKSLKTYLFGLAYSHLLGISDN